LPNGRPLLNDCALAASRAHSVAHPRLAIRVEWARFRSIFGGSFAFDERDEQSGNPC